MKNNQSYALRRMSLAVDRVIRGENVDAAKRWVKLWHMRSQRTI